MLYSEIIALSTEIHTKHIIIYVCRTHNFLTLKLMVHAVTTKLGFKKLNFTRVVLNQVVYRHKSRINLATNLNNTLILTELQICHLHITHRIIHSYLESLMSCSRHYAPTNTRIFL
jgi:hypothetical protein